jgi:MoxR-like ATPase
MGDILLPYLRNRDGTWRNPDFGNIAKDVIKDLLDIEDQALAALLCYFAPDRDAVRHVLMEGINGTAKTRLAKQLNKGLIGPVLRAFYEVCHELSELERTQGSPELSPSDIVGADTLAEGEGTQALRFSPGPLLQNHIVFYADELNRSHPRTQSVLLEAMAEGQVTINTMDPLQSRLHRLKDFFLVASQNPEKHIGTFPLPEAQLDRFMIRIFMPYSKRLAEIIAPTEPDGQQRGSKKATEALANLFGQKRELLDNLTYGWLLQEECQEQKRRLEGVVEAEKASDASYRRLLQRIRVSKALAATLLVNRGRLGRRRSAWAANVLVTLNELEELQKSLSFEQALSQKLGETSTSKDFAVVVEEIIMDIRRLELRRLRIGPAQVAGLQPTRLPGGKTEPSPLAQRIANLVYGTWSRRAAQETIEGLEERLEGNSRVQALTEELQHGSSVRGAQALRDFACALAWARGKEDDEETLVLKREHVDMAAPFVLNHRVRLRNERPQGWYTREKLKQLVQEVD